MRLDQGLDQVSTKAISTTALFINDGQMHDMYTLANPMMNV